MSIGIEGEGERELDVCSVINIQNPQTANTLCSTPTDLWLPILGGESVLLCCWPRWARWAVEVGWRSRPRAQARANAVGLSCVGAWQLQRLVQTSLFRNWRPGRDGQMGRDRSGTQDARRRSSPLAGAARDQDVDETTLPGD